MKQRWRTALVALLVVLTGIVAPVSVVAAWAHTQVSDTEAFVAAYAPLSKDPAVQQVLAANGFPIAARIPPVTAAVDLVQLDPGTVSQARAAYRLLAVVAEWLPWLLLLLPALALFIAADLRRTVIACGAAVAVGIAIAWLALRAGIAKGVAVAAASGLPEAATTAITDGALGPMRGPALTAGLVGVVVAVLAWLTGRTPTRS